MQSIASDMYSSITGYTAKAFRSAETACVMNGTLACDDQITATVANMTLHTQKFDTFISTAETFNGNIQ